MVERAPTPPCKGGQLPQPAGELYIPQSSWPFWSSFFTLFPYIDISFYYFYRFSRHTRTYCENARVKISNIEVFKGIRKWSKIDFFSPSFPSSFFFLPSFPHISFPPIFKHFFIVGSDYRSV